MGSGIFGYPLPEDMPAEERLGNWGIEHGFKNHRRVAEYGSKYWAEEAMLWNIFLWRPKLVRID